MRHPTRLEVLPPAPWRLPRDVGPSSTPSTHLGARIASSATGRRHVFRAPVRCRLGGGAAHLPLGRPSPHVEEPAWVSKQPQRAQGLWPLCSEACTDAATHALSSTLLRLAPGTSSEASGSPTPRTTDGAPCAAQRPCGVCTCPRRHGPAAGPAASTLCPGHVFAPGGAGTAGQRDGLGASAQPRRRRPT
jgi:hypothetical protein